MKKITLLLFISFVYLVANFSVTFAGGEALVVRNGIKSMLKAGDVVGKNDIIQTGNRGFVSLSGSDGSVYKVYANSSLKVEKYINNDKKRFKFFSFLKGKIFLFISKTFRKSEVRILTQHGVVEVKGTSFLLENKVDKFDVYLLEGKLSILDEGYNPLASITAGQFASKFREGDEVEIRQLNKKELKQINQNINVNVKEYKPLVDVKQTEEGEERILKEKTVKTVRDEIERILQEEILKKEALTIIDEVEEVIKDNQKVIADKGEVVGKGFHGEDVKQTYSREGNKITVTSIYQDSKFSHSVALNINYNKLPTYLELLNNRGSLSVDSSYLSLITKGIGNAAGFKNIFEYFNDDVDGNPLVIYNGKAYSKLIDDEEISPKYLFFDDLTGLARYVFPEKLAFEDYDQDTQEILKKVINRNHNGTAIEYVTKFDLIYSAYSNNPINHGSVAGSIRYSDFDFNRKDNSRIDFKYNQGFAQRDLHTKNFEFITDPTSELLSGLDSTLLDNGLKEQVVSKYDAFQGTYYILGYLFAPTGIIDLLDGLDLLPDN